MNLDNLPIDTIIQIIKLIKQLAKNWCFHKDCFIQITLLLNGKYLYLFIFIFIFLYYFFIIDALSIITKNKSNNVCTSNLLMIIYSLQKISNSKRCGPTMICAFIDLLGNFACVSLQLILK